MRRYLTLFIIGFLSIAAVVSGLNYVINPYDYWDVPRLKGLSVAKPEFGRHQLRAKPQQWARLKPDVVVLGNSRVQVGFDPDAAVFGGDIVYNAGFPGIALSGQLKALKAVEGRAKPATLYVGLEFLDFRISKEAWTQNNLTELAPSTMTLRGYAELLWSITAFTDSVKTLAAQFQASPVNVTERGFNPALEFQDFVNKQGYAPLFEAKEWDYIQNAMMRPKRVSWDDLGSNIEWQALDDLIQWAESHDVKLIFFSHPYHVSFLNMIDQSGLWPAFENWKLSVSKRAQVHGIPFWDFAVTSQETAEVVEQNGQMRFYWEAGHYKVAMGDLIMGQMRGRDGFGHLLNDMYMTDYLKSQRLALQRYNGAHPESARRIRDAVHQFSLRKSTSELATK